MLFDLPSIKSRKKFRPTFLYSESVGFGREMVHPDSLYRAPGILQVAGIRDVTYIRQLVGHPHHSYYDLTEESVIVSFFPRSIHHFEDGVSVIICEDIPPFL